MLWGFGLTMFGYAHRLHPAGRRPSSTKYIDLILLVAVGGTALVTLWHYFRERSKAKKAAAAGEDVVTDHSEAEALVLDPEVFERGPEHHEDGAPRRLTPTASRGSGRRQEAFFFAAGFFADDFAAGFLADAFAAGFSSAAASFLPRCLRSARPRAPRATSRRWHAAPP